MIPTRIIWAPWIISSACIGNRPAAEIPGD